MTTLYTAEWQAKMDEFGTWVLERTNCTKAKETKKDVECECGKDKHGFASHSEWCGKAEFREGSD